MLPVYSSGRTNGLSVASGHGLSSVAPVVEGYSLPHATHQWKFGGSDLEGSGQTFRLIAHSQGAGIQLQTSAQVVLIPRLIKEKCCYVSMGFQHELENFTSKQFVMPDLAEVIVAAPDTWNAEECKLTLHDLLIRIPEPLFSGCPDTRFSKLESHISISLPDLVMQAVRDSDADLRAQLLSNVIYSGGSTCFKNFGPRLRSELQLCASRKEAPEHVAGRRGRVRREMRRINMPDCPVHVYSLNHGAPFRRPAMQAFAAAQFCPQSPAYSLRLVERKIIGQHLPEHCYTLPWLKGSGAAEVTSGQTEAASGHPVPAAWIGGSILASLSTFSGMWASAVSDPSQFGMMGVNGYEDIGPRIVRMACNL